MFASEFWVFQCNSLNSIGEIYYKMSLWSCFQNSKGAKESVLEMNAYLCLQEKLSTLPSLLFMPSLMSSVLWFLDIVSP